MKTVLSNDGVQLAIISITIGVALTYFGSYDELGATLVGAGAAYIVGKLQKRPETIALEDIARIDYDA